MCTCTKHPVFLLLNQADPFSLLMPTQNRLTVNYKEGAYYYRYRFPDAPRFTPLQEEALRWVHLRGSRAAGEYACDCC